MKVLFPCEKRSGGFYSSSSSTRDTSRAIVGSDQWFERASIARRSTNDTNRKDAVFVRVGYGGAHSGTYIGMAHLCETLGSVTISFPGDSINARFSSVASIVQSQYMCA